MHSLLVQGQDMHGQACEFASAQACATRTLRTIVYPQTALTTLKKPTATCTVKRTRCLDNPSVSNHSGPNISEADHRRIKTLCKTASLNQPTLTDTHSRIREDLHDVLTQPHVMGAPCSTTRSINCVLSSGQAAPRNLFAADEPLTVLELRIAWPSQAGQVVADHSLSLA